MLTPIGETCYAPLAPPPLGNTWHTRGRYDRVVILDSDVLIVRPEAVHALLTWPLPADTILASRDCAAQ